MEIFHDHKKYYNSHVDDIVYMQINSFLFAFYIYIIIIAHAFIICFRAIRVYKNMLLEREITNVYFCCFLQGLNGFIMMTTQTGKLLYISDNAAEYLGHSMVSSRETMNFFLF